MAASLRPPCASKALIAPPRKSSVYKDPKKPQKKFSVKPKKPSDPPPKAPSAKAKVGGLTSAALSMLHGALLAGALKENIDDETDEAEKEKLKKQRQAMKDAQSERPRQSIVISLIYIQIVQLRLAPSTAWGLESRATFRRAIFGSKKSSPTRSLSYSRSTQS